ncbi:MAG: GNAT family N-acetyltransferase, partial [Proteobacteria bacterium]|nr:GNAT family N-acetyltransferase [Pseudomonadota bacterium]
RGLLRALEGRARGLGKTLLVLDTRSGDHALPLYESEGFRVAGEIPGYCRNPFTDTYEATTYMYKPLT